jgi:hypothetical protein
VPYNNVFVAYIDGIQAKMYISLSNNKLKYFMSDSIENNKDNVTFSAWTDGTDLYVS